GEIQAALANLFKFFAVVGDTAASAAHGEGRTDDARITHFSRYGQCLFHVVSDTGTCGVEADFFHRHVEATTVFCFINRVGGRTNHGHAELFQHALTLQLQRAVQCSLATHGRQNCIRTLFLDDFTYHFPVNRLDV